MKEARNVVRFRMRSVWFHWIHTFAFLVLLVTGAILFFPHLGNIAAGNLSRIIHRIAVIIYVGGPLVYFPFNPRRSLNFIKEVFVWGKNDFIWVTKAPDYYFGGPEEKMPPQGHINTGQKMWQLIVIGTGGIFLVTGVVMWFMKDIVAPVVFQWCLIGHDVAFAISFLMLLVHVYLGIIHPRMTESLQSMIDGKISEKYASHHYGRWYEKMAEKKD
ncbi:formate dehydrogenase subunit gamma [Chloroflexota bacterium]